MTKKAVPSLGDVIQDLTALVWQFDCREANGRLLITNETHPYPGDTRRQHGWKKVGKVRQYGNSPATIVEVYDNAPVYLNPLKNKSFPSKPVLLNAVRCESFRHRAKELFVAYLSAEIKKLTDEG